MTNHKLDTVKIQKFNFLTSIGKMLKKTSKKRTMVLTNKKV